MATQQYKSYYSPAKYRLPFIVKCNRRCVVQISPPDTPKTYPHKQKSFNFYIADYNVEVACCQQTDQQTREHQSKVQKHEQYCVCAIKSDKKQKQKKQANGNKSSAGHNGIDKTLNIYHTHTQWEISISFGRRTTPAIRLGDVRANKLA